MQTLRQKLIWYLQPFILIPALCKLTTGLQHARVAWHAAYVGNMFFQHEVAEALCTEGAKWMSWAVMLGLHMVTVCCTSGTTVVEDRHLCNLISCMVEMAANATDLSGSVCAGGRHQAYYHVLVDHRDRPFQSTYVAQENIVRSGVGEASSSGQVRHWEKLHTKQ